MGWCCTRLQAVDCEGGGWMNSGNSILKATSKNGLFPSRSKSDSMVLAQQGKYHEPARIF